MYAIVNLYSDKPGEINKFLSTYYDNKIHLDNDLKWEEHYENSIEIADIIGSFIDNNNKYDINMWISLDADTFINITDDNADSIIRYLYERFPY